MTIGAPTYDRAVHSDFLIHWTGKDIDADLHPDWLESSHHSRTDEQVVERYLKRLRDILTFGLWMTDEGTKVFKVGSAEIEIPATPQCCFTELRLSESRRHASRYGRLGIGVKRPFLFRRFGRPLAYFGFDENSNDKLLEACRSDLKDKSLLNFFKPMNSSPQPLVFDLYSESEWRILFFQELLDAGRIVDPRDPANVSEHRYFCGLSSEEQAKLKYLIPLDGWFAMLIFPSIKAKTLAQSDTGREIAAQIQRIKSAKDHGNRVERGNWPIELDLDACRHF